MYTGVYCRVSTKNQAEDGTSLGYQIEAGTQKAIELGVPRDKIIVFEEKGFTGEDIDRPEMNRVRDMVVKKQLSKLIVLTPDRLSRLMVDKLIICSELQKHEVELIFVDNEYKDTPEGQLFFNIHSAIAQYELEMIKRRTSRGVINAVKKGKVMPMRTSPYGYDLIDNQLIINKEEAENVKKIFQWYVYDKLTMRDIGERLYDLGVLPKRKESPNWNSSSLQRILKSELYIGKYYYNRRKTKKIKGQKTVSGNPKRSVEMRDREEWYEVDIPVIVDFATFELAQKQRIKNGEKSGNVKNEYLLRRLIRCGCCGTKWSSFTSTSKSKTSDKSWSYKYYRCTNRNSRKYGDGIERCPIKPIKANIFEDYIWETIEKVVNNEEKFIDRLKNKGNKIDPSVIEMHKILLQKIKQKDEEKQRILTLFKKGFIDEDEMDADVEKLRKEKETLLSDIEKYDNVINAHKETNHNIEDVQKQLQKVKSVFENIEDYPKFQREIIEYFVDEIIVNHVDGKIDITFTGLIQEAVSL